MWGMRFGLADLNVKHLCRFDRKSALHTLAKQLATVLIDAEEIAGCMKSIGGASAGAIKLRPTVAAGFP